MATRCRVKCTKVSKVLQSAHAGAEPLYSAELQPVINGSAENEKFYKWTPGGRFDLQTLSGDHFEVGKEYYVDFTPIEAEVPAAAP